MSKILNWREAIKSYTEGKDLQILVEVTSPFVQTVEVWQDTLPAESMYCTFDKLGKYRIKPNRKTLWLAHWNDNDVSAKYSSTNPWPESAGFMKAQWVQNIPERYIEE